MADLRVSSADNFVGASHPTTADTLNRLALQEHNSSGHHASTAFPSFHVNMNGTNFTLSSLTTLLTWSTAGIYADTNSAIDSTDWCYNVPKTGKYFMELSAMCSGFSTDGTNNISLSFETTSAGIIFGGGKIVNNTSTSCKILKLSAILNLASTDRVFARITSDETPLTISGLAAYTHWSGAYLGI